MDNEKEKRAWDVVRRAQSFTHAFRGMKLFIKTTPNALIHICIGILVIIAGFYFDVSTFEWIALIFAIGFVLVSEAFNTAIEIDINLTSPQYHPYAKDTKDVAAGAVLLASFTAFVIGLIIFLPKFNIFFY